jgi:hypothetical protein
MRDCIHTYMYLHAYVQLPTQFLGVLLPQASDGRLDARRAQLDIYLRYILHMITFTCALRYIKKPEVRVHMYRSCYYV